jgi:hypothetical protein
MRVQAVVPSLGRKHNTAFHVCAYNSGICILSFSVVSAASYFTIVAHVARMGKGRLLVGGKPKGRRPLGRPRRRWEDNIKMSLQEVGRGLWGTGWSWLRLGTGGGRS